MPTGRGKAAYVEHLRVTLQTAEWVEVVMIDPKKSRFGKIVDILHFAEPSAEEQAFWSGDDTRCKLAMFCRLQWASVAGGADGHPLARSRSVDREYPNCADVTELILRQEVTLWPMANIKDIVLVVPADDIRPGSIDVRGMHGFYCINRIENESGELENVDATSYALFPSVRERMFSVNDLSL